MRIGIDLGGTKIEIVALDHGGAEVLRRRIPTPAGDYGATVEALVSLAESAQREAGLAASIGIGTPGAVSTVSGLMKNANSTVLNGRPLEADLRARLKRPVRIANDANCFTLSEAVDGAGSDAKVVFGVILGTGAGGGIAVHRRVLAGANGIAGEWAHNPLPWPTRDEQPGPACYCGKSGCIETFVSGPGMAARFRERTNRTLEAREIVQAAREGDAQASAEFDRYVDRLARSLTLVVNVLGPEAIVLGGGLSNVSELYEHLGPAMKPYVFSDSFDTRSGRRGSGTAAACAAPRTSASMR